MIIQALGNARRKLRVGCDTCPHYREAEACNCISEFEYRPSLRRKVVLAFAFAATFALTLFSAWALAQ